MIVASYGPLMVCAVQWGNFAEWLAGVGALLVFGSGLFLYWRQRHEEQSAQASKVHILTGTSYQFAKSPRTGPIRFQLSNTSDAPAYDVHAQLLPWEWEENDKVLTDIVFETLSPGMTTDEQTMPADELPPLPEGYRRAPMAIQFMDARGRRWRRMPDGRLLLQRGKRWRRW